jgi:hypothetical protein
MVLREMTHRELLAPVSAILSKIRCYRSYRESHTVAPDARDSDVMAPLAISPSYTRFGMPVSSGSASVRLGAAPSEPRD